MRVVTLDARDLVEFTGRARALKAFAARLRRAEHVLEAELDALDELLKTQAQPDDTTYLARNGRRGFSFPGGRRQRPSGATAEAALAATSIR